MEVRMKRLVDIMKALGEENRFRIVMMLRERTLCVCDVCSVLDISPSTVSAHLKQLTQAGILNSEKDGRWVKYALKEDPFIRKLVEQVRREVPEESQLEKDRSKIQRIDPATCATFFKKGQH